MENFILGITFAILGLNILNALTDLFLSLVELIKTKISVKISEYSIIINENYYVSKKYKDEENEFPIITGFAQPAKEEN